MPYKPFWETFLQQSVIVFPCTGFPFYSVDTALSIYIFFLLLLTNKAGQIAEKQIDWNIYFKLN